MQDPSPITPQPAGEPVLSAITSTPDDNATGIVVQPPTGAIPPSRTSPEGYRTVPDQTNTGWPPGVPYIVGNEACERFSFYGMRAILFVHLTALYATQVWNRLAAGADSAGTSLAAATVTSFVAPPTGAGPLGAIASVVAQPMAVAASEVSRQSTSSATTTVHLFIAGVYALPMIGALIADRWAGKYRTIFFLSLVYCAGHAVLSLYESLLLGMYVGLGLIAVGSGGIKPCVSANVGDQFGKANWFRVRTVYQIFYFSINFGSFFATLLIPWLKDNAGAILIGWFPSVFGDFDPIRLGTSIAFGVPGVLMFIATFIFWLGRRKFVHVPPRPGGRIGLLDTCCSVSLFLVVGHLFFTPEFVHNLANPLLEWFVLSGISVVFLILGLYLFFLRQRLAPDDGFLAITLYVIRSHLGLVDQESTRASAGTVGEHSVAADNALAKSRFWAPAIKRFGLTATEGPVAVFKIISVFFLVSIFWALFDQHSSTWIKQAGQMDLHLWGERASFLWIPNLMLKPSQVPAANPMLVMLLIPLMNLVYNWCDRNGLKTTPLRRVTVGMLITAMSFAAVALLQQHINNSPANSVWVGWQLIPYLLITIGEVMVSITGLEFAYTQAPKKMKSTVMGFWLLTVTLGNVLVAFLAGFKDLPPATFFWIFAGLSAGAGASFGLRAYFYIPKDYAQE